MQEGFNMLLYNCSFARFLKRIFVLKSHNFALYVTKSVREGFYDKMNENNAETRIKTARKECQIGEDEMFAMTARIVWEMVSLISFFLRYKLY